MTRKSHSPSTPQSTAASPADSPSYSQVTQGLASPTRTPFTPTIVSVPPVVPVMSQKTIDNGYEQFEVRTTPRQATSAVTVRFPKSARASMNAKDLSDLFENAIAKMPTKYAMVAPKLESGDSLKEYATLGQLTRSTRERFVDYDMFDVFNLMFPMDPSNVATSSDFDQSKGVDLLSSYLSVSIETVALSNEWYSRWGTDDHVQNLSITASFFRQNCTAQLYHKILESSDKFPACQQGGPLFFKLLTTILISDYEIVADLLITQLKDFKISSIAGENVSSAVTLVRSACGRLYDIQRLPSTIELILLNLYQTTSVAEFNQLFHGASSQRTYASLASDAAPSHGVFLPARQKELRDLCEEINVRADRAYTRLRSSWNVPAPRKDGGASLVAGSGTPTGEVPEFHIYSQTALLGSLCWNCGSKDHMLRKCPLPPNTAKIDANRKNFRAAKAKQKSNPDSDSSKRSFKWAPPRTEERNRRNIDGKPMIYDHETKRWNPDASAPGGLVATTPAPASAPEGKSVDLEALLAGVTREFGSTVTALSAVAAKLKEKQN